MSRRTVLGGTAALIAGAGLVLGRVAWSHGHQAVYDMHPTTLWLGVVGAGTILAVTGAAAMWTNPDDGLLVFATAVAWILAFAGMLSIGIFVLPVAVALLVLTTRKVKPSRAAGAGVLLAVGLATTAFAATRS